MASPYSRAGLLQGASFSLVCRSRSTRASCEGVEQCEWIADDDDDDGRPDAAQASPIADDPPAPPEQWWWKFVWIGLALVVVLVIVVGVAISRRDAAHLNDPEGDDIDMTHDPAIERDDFAMAAVA